MKNTDTRGALCTLRADSGKDGGCGCILDEAFELYKKGLDEVKSANDMVQGMEKYACAKQRRTTGGILMSLNGNLNKSQFMEELQQR